MKPRSNLLAFFSEKGLQFPTLWQMAASFTPIAGIRPCPTSGHRKPDLDRRKSTTSCNWWTPLVSWSSEADYIDSNSNADVKDNAANRPESVSGSKPSRPRFAPGCFTEEKARQLRLMTKESESFHDTMYHSAIASRLATDFKTPSDK